jgi:signal transduction histidine kinase
MERWRPWLDGALVALITAIGWVAMALARTDADVKAASLTVGTGVVAVLATLPVLWRRQRPLGMLGLSLCGVVIGSGLDDRGLFGGQIAALGAVLLFAIGAWSTHRWWSAAAVGSLLTIAVAGAMHDGTNVVASLASAVTVIVLPVVLGYATRTRRQYVAEVEARLAAAERDRDERARLAVAEERQRLARELHDVVAHHVSLIGVQAGAARTAMARSPEQAAAALAGIEASSRAAVGELRQLLDVLSPIDGVAPPQPGLSALPALVDRWRAAGMTIDAGLTGDPVAVAPTVSLCCYRLVEEALTNVAKHSLAGQARVRVVIGPMVAVEVSDPGPPCPVPDGGDGGDGGAGRGLVGMRERVALCGGSLSVGPHPDGSFDVVASVPAVPA